MKRFLTFLLLVVAVAQAFAQSPMGTTWVVFVENSTYKSFPSIAGPAQDFELVNGALANYQVDKLIHKKNLTGAQLKTYLNTTLPKEASEAGVASLVVWYAGHGKFLNNKSFWIPTDAVRDNESTYFELGALQTSLKSISSLKHALIVSDACESGPSFYQAMRSNPPHRDCSELAGNEPKSAQVFTASGYELAVQGSKFTTSFAAALNENKEACLPMEKIVARVTMDVVMSSGQRPKFGTISNSMDEGGTFFFVRK